MMRKNKATGPAGGLENLDPNCNVLDLDLGAKDLDLGAKDLDLDSDG